MNLGNLGSCRLLLPRYHTGQGKWSQYKGLRVETLRIEIINGSVIIAYGITG
jgi:hypothetical protein